MAIPNYGVLKGKAIDSRAGVGASPHYQVHLVDDMTDYRIAINVKSRLAPSELLFCMDEHFSHPLLEDLVRQPYGFTRLARNPGGVALDYIRGNLFDRVDMRPLAHSIPGPDNDLNEKIDTYIRRAIGDAQAVVYAFGARWGPEPQKKDRYFGFLPGNGIHDIHMNQGSAGRFAGDNGVWQDGALLIHFPAMEQNGTQVWPEQWVALFLAFQSQCWHTDDETGQCLEEAEDVAAVRIVGALVNPAGPDAGLETVTLLNASPDTVELDGWAIADASKRRSPIRDLVLAPGATGVVRLDGSGALLGNRGGIITLLDRAGIKRHGVSYTREQAGRPGWTIVF